MCRHVRGSILVYTQSFRSLGRSTTNKLLLPAMLPRQLVLDDDDTLFWSSIPSESIVEATEGYVGPRGSSSCPHHRRHRLVQPRCLLHHLLDPLQINTSQAGVFFRQSCCHGYDTIPYDESVTFIDSFVTQRTNRTSWSKNLLVVFFFLSVCIRQDEMAGWLIHLIRNKIRMPKVDRNNN